LWLTACTDRNAPDNSGSGNTSTPDSTGTVISGDTTLTSSDTIRISWNGASASVSGSHEGVTVTEKSGYVTVVSTEKDITYLLSGSGKGCLRIEGTNRHQLILSDLTLVCSDGPAINNQCKKSCFVVLNGTNSLTDGSSYATSTEDRKAAFFSEGQMIFSGSGSLTVKGNYKHAIASDDYIQFAQSTGTLTLNAASDGIHANDGIYFDGGTFAITAGSDGVQCDSLIVFNNGSLTVSAGADGIQSDTASITVSGGSITVTKAGDKGMTAFGDIVISDGSIVISSEYKCIKAGKKDDNDKVISAGSITITGGDIHVTCNGTASSNNNHWGSDTGNSSPEAIEAKGAITISGGHIYAKSADDALNAGGDLTISGGKVLAWSTSNDGIDANGNCYIKGGLVYAIGASSPEVAIDANTEEKKKLYISGGTIIAVGGLESGASISGGTCKYTSSWSASSWYALYNGGTLEAAFMTPSNSSSGGFYAPPGGGGPGGGGGYGGPGGGSQQLLVYTSSTPTLKSGVSVSGGTEYFGGMANIGGTVSGGSTVSLSNYSSSGW
jgi:hypothetical protein